MIDLDPLVIRHRYQDSVSWRLTAFGLEVDGKIETTGLPPATVSRVWRTWREEIAYAALEYDVPVELIIATICTESAGRADAIRFEPGFDSDEKTPSKVSPGAMQTLLSTARWTLDDKKIDRGWLLVPGNSILAGTAYISRQSSRTRLDPPAVAAAYNAGGVYYQGGARNRWKMRQYPIGTGNHVDRFLKWFNDCFVLFSKRANEPIVSFYQILNYEDPTSASPPKLQTRAGFRGGCLGRLFSRLTGD